MTDLTMHKSGATRPPDRAAAARHALIAAALAVLVSSLPSQVDAQEVAQSTLPRVEVVGTAILQNEGTPLNQVPANIQTVKQPAAGNPRALNLADVLDQGVGSVHINDTAGNPFQPDINFRGFAASPALGTPQGLSVFVDGVRINEVFGDTVNWDLVPDAAIASITVIPGSNPLFGLNTLGGALNVTTKSGFSNPGTSVQAYGGSFGRRAFEFETGGHGDRLDYFVTGNTLHDAGWAEHNPSRVRQLFAKGGYHAPGTDLDLSLTLADNRLEGSQTLPLSFMNDPRQAYSWPDFQTNRMVFLNLKAAHHLTPTLLLEGNAYFREVRTHVLNSNVDNDFDTAQPAGPGNEPTGNVINQIDQYRPGGSLQLTSLAALVGHTNRLTAGASFDRGHTAFTQANQEAGASRDTSSNEPILLATSLQATATASSAYATDTFGIDPRTFLTLSARYNHATVKLQDQFGTALNGDHSFDRVNPAVGITFNPNDRVTTYASYNEGMRVPTPVELSCADPNAPCSLPNAFSSDPALEPVVSRTFELGARGRLNASLEWSAALFRTDSSDDIQFISSGGGATSAGYFQNVGKTRRQGLELGLQGRLERLSYSAHYSYIDARFETPLILNSPANSTAAPLTCPSCTDIAVAAGNRIPGIPQQIAKLRAEYQFTPRAALGLNFIAQGKQFARGDENNQDVNGPVPGYLVVNLDARLRLSHHWELFARATNVLGRRYSTFATLGQNVFTGAGNSFDASGATWRNEQFRSLGAPRGAWIGVTYQFDGPGVPGT